MSRSRAAALAAVAVLLVGACSGPDATSRAGNPVGAEFDRTLPSQVLDAPLVDSSGRQVTVSSLRGKIVVISDMMTLCQGTCPLDTANVVRAARRVQAVGAANHVVFLSVSVDPARDTRPHLVAYRRQYGPAPANWLALTGSRSAVNRFWNALGVYRKVQPDSAPGPRDRLTGRHLTYDITHSDELFFLDAKGHERFRLDGPPHLAPGTGIPVELAKFLSAEGRADLAGAHAASWTVNQELQFLGRLLGVRL